jgi:hypothetical protein
MNTQCNYKRTISLGSGREVFLDCGRWFHICASVACSILLSPGRLRRTGRFTTSTPAARGCWFEWQRARRTLGRVGTGVSMIGRVACASVWVPRPLRTVGRRGGGCVAGELGGDETRGARRGVQCCGWKHKKGRAGGASRGVSDVKEGEIER